VIVNENALLELQHLQ